MPVVWNVQPYRLLSELRQEYTQFTLATSRTEAEKLAGEAQEWMRENAPWKDRTQEERDKARSRKGFPSARSQLRVRVLYDAQEQAAYKAGFSQAARQDSQTIERVNREMYSRALQNLVTEKGALGVPRTQTQRKAFVKQYEGQTISRLPKSQSAMHAFQQQWRKTRIPFVELRFEHGREDVIPYGIWLEIAHQGRYNIIKRSLDHWGPILMRRLQPLVNLKQFKGRGVAETYSRQRTNMAMSQEDKFANFVRKYEDFEGRTYKPFTREVREKKAAGRAYRRRSR